MSTKEVVFGTSDLIAGVNILAAAVSSTLGPKGRNVIIERPYGQGPLITKDGATVAREIVLDDRKQNVGAQLVKDVAANANARAGDGTTTATVLAREIVMRGLEEVTSGLNPIAVKRGIDEAVKQVIEYLRNHAVPCNGAETIEFVSLIGANGDQTIGGSEGIVAKAMAAVGTDGVIIVEDGRGFESELIVSKGMQFDNGYLSPYFITNEDEAIAEFDNPFILMTTSRITNIRQILPVLEEVSKTGRALVLIAEDVESDVLASLVVNCQRNILKVAAVKAPAFGDHRQALLQDMAVVTGGTLIDQDAGIALESVTLKHLGQAQRIQIARESTTIIDGNGDKTLVTERTDTVRRRLQQLPDFNSYDANKLRERLAKLASGIGVIKVGGATEVEMRERKARVQDSLASAQAAVAEGVVAGGGIALLEAGFYLVDSFYEPLKALLNDKTDTNVGRLAGISVLLESLKAPFTQIVTNAGLVPHELITEIKRLDQGHGFDAADEKFCNMFESGIIDPVKVTRSALEAAASIAGMLLTTDVLIVGIDDKTNPFAKLS